MIRLNSERSRPVSVRADFHRGLDESTAATGNRLSARGESGAARATRRSPTSFHGRPASPACGASQRARPTRAVADRNDRHRWDSPGLAPKADRSKARWERQPWSRPTAHGSPHRIAGGTNGCREPCRGLHAHRWCTVESVRLQLSFDGLRRLCGTAATYQYLKASRFESDYLDITTSGAGSASAATQIGSGFRV